MLTYYAIACQGGQWVYICAGREPEEVYRQAIAIIESQETYLDDEGVSSLSPGTESLMDTLRVVPEETAKEHYHVVFSRQVRVED
ncbi:MAG TPA: hypothetical protein VGL77_05955 [Armatimonadota bacterium]|jgi:hypothetical protein